jgi:ribosomal protein S27E
MENVTFEEAKKFFGFKRKVDVKRLYSRFLKMDQTPQEIEMKNIILFNLLKQHQLPDIKIPVKNTCEFCNGLGFHIPLKQVTTKEECQICDKDKYVIKNCIYCLNNPKKFGSWEGGTWETKPKGTFISQKIIFKKVTDEKGNTKNVPINACVCYDPKANKNRGTYKFKPTGKFAGIKCTTCDENRLITKKRIIQEDRKITCPRCNGTGIATPSFGTPVLSKEALTLLTGK